MTPRKPFEFVATDFDSLESAPSVGDYGATPEQMAAVANKLLREWLDAAPVVHGTIFKFTDGGEQYFFDSRKVNRLDTHKARLVEIEEIQGAFFSKSGSDILKDRYIKGDPKREADLATERLNATEEIGK